MTNDLNSAFKRQLNSKSKNKIVRLLSVILLVIIIMFSIFFTGREGGATPKEVVKGWMKTVRKNDFEKMFDYIYYDNKKDKDESVQEFKKISKEEKYKLDMLQSFVNDNEIDSSFFPEENPDIPFSNTKAVALFFAPFSPVRAIAILP